MNKQKLYSVSIKVALVIKTGFLISVFIYCFSFLKIIENDMHEIAELTSKNISLQINHLIQKQLNATISVVNETSLQEFLKGEAAGVTNSHDWISLQESLVQYEKEFGIKAYLIDSLGNIMISTPFSDFENMNLFTTTTFDEMANTISSQCLDLDSRWFHSQEIDGYAVSQDTGNLDLYLVVDKNTNQLIQNRFVPLYFLLFLIILISSMIIIMTIKLFHKYNLKMNNLAMMDPLTGIRNRTSYEVELLKYNHKLVNNQTFGIGLCDLNDLKLINDQFGHQVGDCCLKDFAAKLCKTFSHCPTFRIGGDEFAIIFIDIPEVTVLELWNQLLLDLGESDIGIAPLTFSAAFGYAFWEAEQLNTLEKIFKSADEKMYQNKNRNKNHSSRDGLLYERK